MGESPEALPGLAIEAVEWLPSGSDSGLVRVRGRWTSASAARPGLPLLVLRSGADEHRFESLPDARFARDPSSWRGSYLVTAALVMAEPGGLWVEWSGGVRAGLPPLAHGLAMPPPAPPAVAEEPEGGQLIDRGVLAERRARRAEAAEREQARIAAEALRAVEALELQCAELERRLAAAAGRPAGAAEPDAPTAAAEPHAPPPPVAAPDRQEAALAGALGSLARLRAQSQEWRLRMRTAEITHAGDAVRLAVLESERRAARTATHDALDGRARDLAAARALADSQATELEQAAETTARAHEELAAARAEAARLRDEISAARDEGEARVAEATAVAEAERAELEEIRRGLEARVDELSRHTSALEAHESELRLRVADLEAALAATETRLHAADAAAAATEGRLRVESVARSVLEDELDLERGTHAAALQAAAADRDAVRAALESASAERDAALARLESRTAERDAVIAELEAARADRASEAARLGALTAERDALMAELHTEREAAALLAADAPEALSGEAGAELTQRLEAELAAARESISTLASRLASERAAREQAEAAARSQGSALQERIAELDRRAAGLADEVRLADAARRQAEAAAAAARPPEEESDRMIADLDAAAAALRNAADAPEPPSVEPPAGGFAEGVEPQPATAPERVRPPIVPATGPPPRSQATGSSAREYPPLRGALVKLAHDDPVAAGKLLVALLPAHGAALAGELDYDLTIREIGTFSVRVTGGRTRVAPMRRPRPRRETDFHLSVGALTLAEMLAGVDHRIGRFRGAARCQGSRRKLNVLRALPATRLGLVDAVRAGARPEPGLVYRTLAYAVPPAWTRGESFTIAQEIADSGQTWYVTARDGGGLAVTLHRPPTPPAATVSMDRETFDLLLRREPVPSGRRPVVRGDQRAVARLAEWTNRLQGLA